MVDRNVETLAEQLLTWPTSDRARLAALLIASLESSEPGVAAAWDEEITRRATELDAGTVSSIPATEVFAELDRRLGQLFREAVRIGLDRIMAQPEIGAARHAKTRGKWLSVRYRVSPRRCRSRSARAGPSSPTPVVLATQSLTACRHNETLLLTARCGVRHPLKQIVLDARYRCIRCSSTSNRVTIP